MANKGLDNKSGIKDAVDMHPIFSKDPSDWMRLVHSQVRVCTEDEKQHVGCVYTVDPVSQSIVLVNTRSSSSDSSDPNNVSLTVIMGPSVRSVDVIAEGTEQVKQNFDRMFRPASDELLTEEELRMRMTKLKSWLEKHRLPVSIGGPDGQSLTIAEALTVRPPYTEDSCLSTNEIILSRIQGLIKNMPDDHETW